MKIKNLIVADVMYPKLINETTEEYTKIPNCILRKLENHLDMYENLETGTKHRLIKRRGFKYIDDGSVKPLSDYYYRIGLKKKNNHENKEIVYQKVKTLKEQKIKL